MPDSLVVLDIGGTLVEGPDTGPARRLAAALGIDPDRRRQLQHALMTRPFQAPEEVVSYLHEELGVPGATQAVTELWEAQAGEARPLPGALAAVGALADEGFRLAVISNIWRPYLESAREHFGALIDARVEPGLQVFSYLRGDQKPSPAMFETVLRESGVAAGRSVIVGDSYSSDLEPAMRMGMKTVWTLHRPEKEVTDLVRVLNGAALAPSRTVASIAAVDGTLVRSLVDAA